jgi:hypothetical protein
MQCKKLVEDPHWQWYQNQRDYIHNAFQIPLISIRQPQKQAKKRNKGLLERELARRKEKVLTGAAALLVLRKAESVSL